MKKLFLLLLATVSTICASAGVTLPADTMSVALDEVTVTSLYRNNVNTGSLVGLKELKEQNVGQGPDYVLSTLPNIYAYNDCGLQMGYQYMRMRGMGQERMNVTIDGMPWNEAEDFGCYFSNMPNLMASMHSIKAEKGASVTTNGTAAYAGNISLESADLRRDTESYATVGGGSFNSYRANVVYNMGVRHGWGLHVSATSQQTDGYKENCFNNSKSGVVKLGYFFNSRHSIDFLSMNGFHRNGQGYQGVTSDLLPTHPTPFKQAISGNRQQETDNFFMSTNRLQYNGKYSDNVYLTSTLYWNHLKGDYRIGWPDDSKPTGWALNNYDLVQHLYGMNAIAKWYASEKLSVQGGVNAYMFQRRHKGYDVPGDTIINVWHPKNFETYYNNIGYKPDVNLFATVCYSPVEKLQLKGSLQYRYTALHYRVDQSAYGDPDDADFDHSWNFVNWGIGATYQFDGMSKVYARFAVTNREPSRTDLFCAEYRTAESEMNTDNERVYDLEVGYDLRHRLADFNVNLFYMDLKDELVATGELSPMNFLPLHEQHDAYRMGVEFATDVHPFRTLHFIFNAAVSSNRLLHIDEHEKVHTFSPAGTIFSELNYTFKSRYKIGVNTRYRSKMYMDLMNTCSLKANATLNAYVKLEVSRRVELGLTANNITNRLNVSNGSVSDGVGYYIVDAPFNFFGTATFKF